MVVLDHRFGRQPWRGDSLNDQFGHGQDRDLLGREKRSVRPVDVSDLGGHRTGQSGRVGQAPGRPAGQLAHGPGGSRQPADNLVQSIPQVGRHGPADQLQCENRLPQLLGRAIMQKICERAVVVLPHCADQPGRLPLPRRCILVAGFRLVADPTFATRS
ncbi:MAG TPA: hypothetical protein VN767_26920 [Streptosporangiaceae bacterium]|nr:hypothetical protein [Streptosporangiaceae bacterium]